MISILLDSSTTSLSVGIAKDGAFVDGVSYVAWQKQSELMIPELDKLLTKHHFSREDIKEVLLGIGPGSYTGVRIALCIGKVICTALNVPMYAFSSLQLLKYNDEPSICLINARSNRSYFGVYKGKDVIVKDTIKTNEEVKEYIASHPGYKLCGDISYLYLEETGVSSDIFLQMLSLRSNEFLERNPLGVKPIYLKD